MRPTLRRLESQMQPTSGAAEAVDQTSLAQRPRENLLAGSLPYGQGQGTLARPKSLPGLPLDPLDSCKTHRGLSRLTRSGPPLVAHRVDAACLSTPLV